MLVATGTATTSLYLWLFALLQLGRGQGIENTSDIRSVNNANLSCLVPPQPTNGEWKLHRSLCTTGGEVDCDISQGLELELGSHLVYRCTPGYEISGNTDVYCEEEGSWSPLPVCIEDVRCNPLKSRSTSTSCTSPSGDLSNCDLPMPPGTRAEISCSIGYKKELSTVSAWNGTVCDTNGNWKPDPLTCIPAVCGEAPPSHQTSWSTTNGNWTYDFPWHASIYAETITANRSEKVFTCGAAIIKDNFLLTAAKCINDKSTNTTVDPQKLFVMVGNVVSDYDSPLHNPLTVGKGAVRNVYRDCPGQVSGGKADFALLELQEPLHFSEIILPACLDLEGIAGFGNQDDPRTLLPCSQCRSSDVAQYKIHIGTDRFCARYINGSAFCDENKGGGLVIEEDDLWQVIGFVGVNLGVDLDDGERTCDKYPFSIHVRVSNYFLQYN